MNIIYINHYAGGPAYGMEYRPFYLAREWVKAGHQVTIVAASEAHVRAKRPVLTGDFTEEWHEGVRFVWCQTPAYEGNGVGRVLNMFAFLRRISQYAKWMNGRPDVVIASSTYPLDIYPARKIARKFNARLIWEVHDLWPLSPIELGGMSRRHPFIMLMQRGEDAACRDADVVVSMLPKADQHLREHGMAQEKFVYVPNGIDPAEWEPLASSALPAETAQQLAAEREQGHFLVAYAGAHGIANALDSVLDAAARCSDPSLRFVIVGQGPEKGRLQQRAVAEGLNNVLLLPPVSKSQIPSLLSAMDVLYIGLQSEPLFRFGISPNKLMDYMMAARPILCAIDAGNDPVTDAGCGITIAPEDPDAILAALAHLKSMGPDGLAQMGAAGRVYVERYHVYPVLARRFETVMNKQ